MKDKEKGQKNIRIINKMNGYSILVSFVATIVIKLGSIDIVVNPYSFNFYK